MSAQTGAPVREAPALAHGKAQALLSIAPHVTCSRVPQSLLLPREAWERERDACVRGVRQRFGAAPLAVRSARVGEDVVGGTAGRYLSRIGVSPEGFAAAVDAVLDSYGGRDAHDAVLVQPALENVTIAAVAANRSAATGAQYTAVSLVRGACSGAVTRGDAEADT